MAALVAAIAVRDVLVPTGLLILDSPDEGMDAANAAKLAQGINAIKERFGAVYIASHNTNVLTWLEPDHEIQVTKRNGVASIVSL